MTVRLLGSEHGRYRGRPTLAQRFMFDGAGAAVLAGVLLSAPLTGDGSIFGARPGTEEAREGGRRLRGFSPAPGFRFDVELTPREDGLFVVRFTQPGRSTPYLRGELTWTFRDVPGGAVLDEQINTEHALAVVAEPLGGPRPSLRRRLFFKVGHRRVMQAATQNLATLAASAG